MTMRASDEPDVDPIAMVEACCAVGAARVDPVWRGIVEALARRASMQQGEARTLLVRRIEELLAEHAVATSLGDRSVAALDEFEARRAVLARLTELVARLDRVPTSLAPPQSFGSVRRTDAPRVASPSRAASPASLKAVIEFKGTWSRLRAEQRLRQALAQVPAMAGPLNSSHVTNRTLQAMRDLSPEYLEAFMLHVDVLLWLERAIGGGAELAPYPARPTEGKRRHAARTARKA
jgi:hypothetical protein